MAAVSALYTYVYTKVYPVLKKKSPEVKQLMYEKISFSFSLAILIPIMYQIM